MPAMSDNVFDNGLNHIINNAEKLYILNIDPGLDWAKIATNALGVKEGLTISPPEDRAGGGRQVVVAQIMDGIVTAPGTNEASHWAITDDSASEILVSGDLSSLQPIFEGNVFTLPALPIGMPDPVYEA